jgi:hypothetical protein
MAVQSNLPLNGRPSFPPQRRGEGKSDTVTAKPIRMMRNGIEAKRMNQRLQRDPSKIFDGLQTLYG